MVLSRRWRWCAAPRRRTLESIRDSAERFQESEVVPWQMPLSPLHRSRPSRRLCVQRRPALRSHDRIVPARRAGRAAIALLLMLSLTAATLRSGQVAHAAPADTMGGQTFSYTGGLQTYTVPADAVGARITAVGAAGGGAFNNAGVGLGSSLQGDFPLNPGDQLTILV